MRRKSALAGGLFLVACAAGGDEPSDAVLSTPPPLDVDDAEEVATSELHSDEPRHLEDGFLERLNTERRSRGLNELPVYWELAAGALAWSEQMRINGDLSHNPDLHSIAPAGTWSSLGENVGRGGSVPSLHDAFMASPGHRANILGDWDYVGVGVVEHPGEPIWVTVAFMASDLVGLEAHLPPFRDDEGSTHEANIRAIAEAGITVGCNPPENDHYCPDDPVTRAQMAVFLVRALSLPASSADHFVDDDHIAWAEPKINSLADAGITLGCNPPDNDRYCPEDPVTRAQMAVFLVRALSLPASSADHFVDDDHIAWAEPKINSLADAGITRGCNPPAGDRYCPDSVVTRAQMATFLARALELTP